MIPMSFTKEGSLMKIEKLLTENSIKKHLMEIGISKGSHITIVKNDSTGLIINLEGSKIALDKSLASKIYVLEI